MKPLNEVVRGTVVTLLIASLLIILTGACRQAGTGAGRGENTPTQSTPSQVNTSREPTIEASPVEQGEGGYKVANSDRLTLSVLAPGASEVRLLYRPVISGGRYTQLKTLAQPADGAGGNLRTEIQTPEDFNGEVWARAIYPDGSKKETEHIALTTRSGADGEPPPPGGTAGAGGGAGTGGAVGDDESARSDRATCVRMLTADVFDLTQKIARARNLPVSSEEVERARKNTERKVIDLGEPLPVDINYDTHVVEGGSLRLYPDVYRRDTNTVERLRAELENAGVDASKLEDAALRQMMERVSSEQQFVVRVADIRAGRALDLGKTEPLTPRQAGSGKSGSRERRESQ